MITLIYKGGVGAQFCQFPDAIGWSLHDESAMVKQQGAQSGKFLASSRPSRPAVQTAWHDVPVARVLGPNGRIDSQDSPMEVADSKNRFAGEARVIGKHRSHQ